ncbi:hypothetical protein MMC12_004352 [Toensbergia leucococca]|nr:hypothetical protein [Toensbergia leucococca]
MAPQQSNTSSSSSDSRYTHRESIGSDYTSSPTNSYSTSPTATQHLRSYTHSKSSQPVPPLGINPPRSDPKPKSHICLVPGCDSAFARSYDLNRHQATHYDTQVKYDCPSGWCNRQGKNGFTRKDHLKDHQRKVHMKSIPMRGAGRAG